MKLFAFDLDKTTLNSKGKLSTLNSRTLDIMISKGIILVPATGRNLDGISNEILEKGIRYAITSNGSKIIDLYDNKVIWKSVLPDEVLKILISKLSKKKFLFTVHADGKCYDSNLLQAVVRKILFNGTSAVLKKFSDIVEIKDIEKIQLILFSKKSVLSMYDLICDISVLHSVKSSEHGIEITNVNATKGDALQFLSEYLNIDRKEIVCIGDNDNDIEMLSFSGTSYAVENASEKVKKVADYVVSDNNANPLKDIKLD